MPDKLRESIAADFQKVAKDDHRPAAWRHRSNHVRARTCRIRRPRAGAARQARRARQDAWAQSGAIALRSVRLGSLGAFDRLAFMLPFEQLLECILVRSSNFSGSKCPFFVFTMCDASALGQFVD